MHYCGLQFDKHCSQEIKKAIIKEPDGLILMINFIFLTLKH